MQSPFRVPARVPGFSLLELLVVMAIIIIMVALAGPAMNAIRGGNDLTKTTSDVSDLIKQARTYAMANNTYVYLGLKEVDSMSSSNAAGKGRLLVGIVASKTGARPYSGASPTTIADDTNKIAPLGRLQKFDSVHLATQGDMSDSGRMSERMKNASVEDVGGSTTATTFQWPVGAGTTTFDKVIEFDPQGVARYPKAGIDQSAIQGWLEIPLLPSRGNAGPAAGELNMAAIQVDGMTGATRIYRP